MKAPAARARRWKDARRSRSAEREASGGGAPRALRNARTLISTAAVLFGGGSTLLACPTCFGAEETAMVDGTKLGILVMLGITLAVQGGFVGFFLYLRKRAKRIAELELDTEWSELQSRTS